MEKSYQEELVKFKGMIRSLERSCALNGIQEENAATRFKNKIIEKKNREGGIVQSNSTIFINPVKLNTVHPQKQLLNIQKSNQNIINHNKGITKKGSATVYINPNFSNSKNLCDKQFSSEILSGHQASFVHTKSNSQQNKYVSKSDKPFGSFEKGNSLKKTHALIPQAIDNLVSKTSCPVTNNLKIFINPEFRLQQKFERKRAVELNQKPVEVELQKQPNSPSFRQSLKTKGSKLLTENHCKSSSKLVDSDQHNELDTPTLKKKRKIYMNCRLSNLEVVSVKKKKRSIDEHISNGNRIFLNPKFNRGFEDSEVPSTSHTEKENPKDEISQGGVFQQNISMANTSLNFNNNQFWDVSKKIPSPSPENKKIQVQPKGLFKNIIGHKLRTRSTSFVSVSPTKLIRKRKLSQNIPEPNIKAANKPMFLTKTKLVRYTTSRKHGKSAMVVSKVTNRSVIAKYKLNLTLQNTNPHFPVDSTNKIKKKKTTVCKTNSAAVVPTSTVIARIRSKNGKSLKLVRTNIDNPLPESSTALQTQKNIIKHRTTNRILCNTENNFTKKKQFSKVNIPAKNLCNRTKYVYKKSDSKENMLTKSDLMDQRKKLALIKLHGSSNASDKIKFIKSKYCLIRKHLLKSANKSSKDTVSRKCSSLASNRKWKSQNNLVKTNNKRKNMKIVNIGGVFYHCSHTSLTKNNQTHKKTLQGRRKGLLLHIHGKKFQLENNGKTLRCLDKNHGRRRIDIGGVTYIKSSSGTSLTRTNYHTARSILVQAKQRSIMLLNRKLKKNYEPCLFYHRFGRCSGKERGTCVRQHDSRYLTVCKKFVQGTCSDNQCLLSHEMTCHNMPTCQHFLAGHCGRDNCPYPHIKVSDSAPLCLDFLKGFCSLGDKCAKRHRAICPSYEKGSCARGKYCPYPHPKSKSDEILTGKFKYLKSKPQLAKDFDKVSNSNLRYFENTNLQSENEILLAENSEKVEKDSDSEEDEERSNFIRNRPRLGRLPSFIPLSLDDSTNNACT